MKNRSRKRSQKSLPAKVSYHKTITSRNLDATVDEEQDFNSTTETGSDTSMAKSEKKRPEKFWDKVKIHLSEHAIEYIIAALGVSIFTLYTLAVSDLRIVRNDMAHQKEQVSRLYTVVDNLNSKQDQDMEQLQSSIDKVNDDNDEQNILLTEIKVTLENLKETLQNKISE